MNCQHRSGPEVIPAFGICCCKKDHDDTARHVRFSFPAQGRITTAHSASLCALLRRRLPAYSVQGRCRVIRVGCCLVAARSYFAGGCAAPCIRGCGPDRRGLAGCAALPVESLVSTMLVLLATPSCSGRGAMRWPSKELRGSVFCAAMTEYYRIWYCNATGFGRAGTKFFCARTSAHEKQARGGLLARVEGR